jgi:hypothetical protein
MADLRERIAAEMENIEEIIGEIKKFDDISIASMVELAGLGAFLHNFYTSIDKDGL